jgi:RES domain-containing protein
MAGIAPEGVESALNASPSVALRWAPVVRIIPRFPPIEQLEQFDGDIQAAVLAELASVTPGFLGELRLLPSGALPAGPGASRIVTSYTFSRPGRFNDDTFGAFYGAESLATAIRETIHHILGPLRDSNAPAQTLPPRLALHVVVDASDVVDARSAGHQQIYQPDDYRESQRFGALARARGHQGIVYRSIRRVGGECVAVYDPLALSDCREDRELIYRYVHGTIEVSEVHFTGGA